MGRTVRLADVAEVAQNRDAMFLGVVPWRRKRVIDEAVVKRLIVVGIAGKFRPCLARIKVEIFPCQCLFCEPDKGGMQADEIQCRRTVERYRLEGRKLR